MSNPMTANTPDRTYKTEAEYRKGGWRCFHCDETFTTPGAAKDHFGDYINSTPGCVLKVQLGDERGWLMEIRKLQAEVSDLRDKMGEEYWDQAAFAAHLKTLLFVYRPFRKCSTIQDVFFVFDSMEGRALSAEEKLEGLEVHIMELKRENERLAETLDKEWKRMEQL